jgi:hypothetical protein
MKKIIMVTTAITVVGIVATTVMFNSCRKVNEKGEVVSEKMMQSTETQYTNPFSQYGTWHNECLKYMLSNREKNKELTTDKMWLNYGVPYFRNIFGTGYTFASLDELHAIYNETYDIVVNKKYLNLLAELVDVGLINPDLNIEKLIKPDETVPATDARRNNYAILRDYFTFLTNHTVTSETEYWFAFNKLCAIEQEILANYYALLNSEIVNADGHEVIKREYTGTLAFTSVSISTTLLWGKWVKYYGYSLYQNMLWEAQELAARVDATAFCRGLKFTNDLNYATECSTNSSFGIVESIL